MKRQSKKLWIGTVLFLSIIFTSYGYAALNTELSISGEAYVRVEADIRITDFKMVSATTGSYETYNNKYSKDSISMFVTLPNINSNVIYDVEITNKSNKKYVLTDIIGNNNNTNIKYELLDIEKYDIIGPNSVKKFKIKISNKTNTSQNSSINLDYKFEVFVLEPPTIKGGNTSWTENPVTINLETEGTATNGIKNYEYYITRSSSRPSDSTIATGTTNNTISVDLNGITNVYYRTVANDGTKSSWSNGQKVYYDNTLLRDSLDGTYDYTGYNRTLCLGLYTEIDGTSTYNQSITIKTSDTSIHYWTGLCQFDVDYLPISSSTIMYTKGSTTTLARDLNNGDTVVYLNDASGFVPVERWKDGFIFWNYTDSTGYTYPKETYSRNVYYTLYSAGNINYTNNTITLNSPWNNGTIKKGTSVSQSSAGATYHYGLLNGEASLSYQTYTNTISGYGTLSSDVVGSDPIAYNKFFPATKYVKTLITTNANTVFTTNVSNYYFKKIN